MTLLLSSNGRTEAWPVSREDFEKNAGAVYRSLSNLKTRHARRTGNGRKFYRASQVTLAVSKIRTDSAAAAITHSDLRSPRS